MSYTPLSLLVFLGFLIAGSYGVHYMMEIDDSSRELSNLQNQIDGIQRVVDSKKAIAASGEEVASELSVLQETKSALSETLQNAQVAMRELEATYSYLCDAMPSTISKVRERAVGETIEELKTSDGKTYKQARIKEVTDDEISLLHSDGSSRVPRSLLPPDLVDRFRMGKPLPGRSDSSTFLVSSDTTPSSNRRLKAEDAVAAEAALQNQRITKLNTQIEQAKRNRDAWMTQATRAEAAVQDAKSRGRPTWKDAEAAKAARNAVDELDKQISKAELLLVELQAGRHRTE